VTSGSLGFVFRGTTISPAASTTTTGTNNAAAGNSSDNDVYIAIIAVGAVLAVILAVVLAVHIKRSRREGPREPNMVMNNRPSDKGGVSDVDNWFANEGTATSFRGFDGVTQTHYYGPVATKTHFYPPSTKTYLDPHAVHDSPSHAPTDASPSQPTHFYPAESSGWNPHFA